MVIKLLTLCLAISINISFGIGSPAECQTNFGALDFRASLVKAVEDRARRDVELGKPMENAGGLNVLFGKEAGAAGLSMSAVLNLYEATYTATIKTQPWWTRLDPKLGWIATGILFLLFVFRDFVKNKITKLLDWFGASIYKRIAGYRLFWWLSLRRYRRALHEKYRYLNIPFRPGRPLDMQEVYVPVKVAETGNNDLLDAYQAIKQYKTLVAIGAPGSGKSMLLRTLALRFAHGHLTDFPDDPIPILLELNRLNESEKPLREQLVDVLEQNNFPGAVNFVKTGLEQGRFILLFDGFDEVNSDFREKMSNAIKDLRNEGRAILTCRSAVYRDEFADWANQKCTVVEFSDQQMQRFLTSWQPDMPSGKSIDNLLRSLFERPRLMVLARNPLLLTIIAYLYTDTEFMLPHSRAEFYDKSVEILLEQWKEKRNHYKGAHKRLLLQHLALFNQDSIEQDQDRRTIDLPSIIAETQKVLPSLGLKDEDASTLIDEVVERSGLLIKVDGGVGYQFTHLTLQEFFAAQALKSKPDALVTRFRTDHDAWRESVKLWCGFDHDSTQLIRAIYEIDRTMAFECLGDAQQIQADFSAEMIFSLKEQFLKQVDMDESVIRAFATVAADPRPRGKQVFDFLVSTFRADATPSMLRLGSANALVLTNLPQAADLLAEAAVSIPALRPLVAQMGDLAVPGLTGWAKQGHVWAIDALYTVGTPSAAQALVPVLWDDNELLQYNAALRLATLLHKPQVESSFYDYALSPMQRLAETIDWVWDPFAEEANSNARVIAGRVAHLLKTARPETIPLHTLFPLDPRLTLPLCAIISNETTQILRSQADHKLVDEIVRLNFSAGAKWQMEVNEPINLVYRLFPEGLKGFDHLKAWWYMFSTLPKQLQDNFLRRFFDYKYRSPTENDWRNIYEPADYEFRGSWHSQLIKFGLVLPFSLAVFGLGMKIQQSPQLLTWANALFALLILGALFVSWFIYRFEFDIDTLEAVLTIVLLWITFAAGTFAGMRFGINVGFSVGVAFGLVCILAIWLSSTIKSTLQEKEVLFLIIPTGIGLFVGAVSFGFYGFIFGGAPFAGIASSVFTRGNSRGLKGFNEIVKFFSIGTGFFVALALVFYFSTNYLVDTFNPVWGISFWLFWVIAILLISRDAERREYASNNPLRGLLDAHTLVPDDLRVGKLGEI